MKSIVSVFTLVAVSMLGSDVLAQQPASTAPSSRDDEYALGPDSQAHAGVPEGTITEFIQADSKTFPGFKHKWWLYIPAQYDGRKPAALMVFQDGEGYMKRDGRWRV